MATGPGTVAGSSSQRKRRDSHGRRYLQICHKPIESADEIHWRHSGADNDEYCGTGDGSTAYHADAGRIERIRILSAG